MTVEHKHMKMDRLGLTMSGLCLVHCLGTPLLLILFPFIGGFSAIDHWIHLAIAAILVPIAIVAVTQGYVHHRRRIVPILAGLGGTLVLIGSVYPMLTFLHDHDYDHSHNAWFTTEVVLTILGSVALVACHSLNIWFCRNKKSAHSHCQSGH